MNIDCEECVGCTVDVRRTKLGEIRSYSCIYKHGEDEEGGHLCDDFEITKHITVYIQDDNEDN